MSNARKKVMTGMELHMADATVVEVYLRLTLARFKLSVFLQRLCNQFSSSFFFQKKKATTFIIHAYSTRNKQDSGLHTRLGRTRTSLQATGKTAVPVVHFSFKENGITAEIRIDWKIGLKKTGRGCSLVPLSE